MNLLFAIDTDGTKLWVYLFFAAASVIGGIISSIKKDKTEKPAPPTMQKRDVPPPKAPPVPPKPPRVPVGAPKSRGARPPIQRPMEKRQPARPVPIERPGARPVPRAVERPAPRIVAAPIPAQEPVPRPLVSEPAVARAPAQTDAPAPQRELPPAVRLLHSHRGLTAAMVLTEVLAPPVALRENHLP